MPIEVGNVYGKLTVIEKTEERRDGRPVWLCQCECGNYKKISSKYVVKGKSCGYCGLDLDENDKPHNKYEFFENYAIGYTSKGERFFIDIEDYEKVYNYCWYKMNNGYICFKNDNKQFLMHRLITNCEKGLVVDHINHNKADNRRINLRVCGYSDNIKNARVQITASTGIKYVVWNKQCKKYQVSINDKYYGQFNNIYLASEAAKRLEKQQQGEYSYYNSLYNHDDIREKLFIDIDGCLINTIKAICDLYNEDFKYYDGFQEVKEYEVNTYDFEECNCATKEQIDTYFNQPRFFEKVEFMPYAKEVIEELSDRYNIIFISLGDESNLLLKEVFLNKNLPGYKFIGIDINKYKDKSHVDMSGAKFIDDSNRNLSTSNALNKYCFGDLYPWNKECKEERLYNWTDVKMHLLTDKDGINGGH